MTAVARVDEDCLALAIDPVTLVDLAKGVDRKCRFANANAIAQRLITFVTSVLIPIEDRVRRTMRDEHVDAVCIRDHFSRNASPRLTLNAQSSNHGVQGDP